LATYNGAASCWWKMKPICSSFDRCAPCDHCAAYRHKCCSVAGIAQDRVWLHEPGNRPPRVPATILAACERLPAVSAPAASKGPGLACDLAVRQGWQPTAIASQSLAAELGIQLSWLPKRVPQLNPLDT
jgi:hypothetical protein